MKRLSERFLVRAHEQDVVARPADDAPEVGDLPVDDAVEVTEIEVQKHGGEHKALRDSPVTRDWAAHAVHNVHPVQAL